ncbi:replication-relaxation family protein [Gracilibacillus sp. YIM 98692]|uniref:replication-relaxation family protein n=1 Tax=Gracilibacillus sp. YIM 98692 TaxID=2663532 RepID=UPI0013D0E7A7|nr:replication-relaxation family protein [Gracilibacillus sp. YIM 98692]
MIDSPYYSKTTFYSFQKVNKQKGLNFKNYELMALRFLAKQKLLTSKQFRNILLSFDSSLTTQGMRNRINRLKDANVLGIRKAHTYVKNDYHKIFIKPFGVRILVELDFLSVDWLKKNTYQYRDIRYLDHFLSIKELTVSSFIASYRYGHKAECNSPYYYKDNDMSTLMPDQVIQTNDAFINLEIDSGSETLSTVMNKCHMYLQLAKSYRDKQFIVLFSTIDRSIPLYNNSSIVGKRRINNIKKELSKISDFHERNNMDIYVFPVTESKTWINTYFSQSKEQLDVWMKKVADTAAQMLDVDNDLFSYTLERKRADQLYPSYLPSFIQSNDFYQLYSHSLHSHKNMLIVPMLAGRVKDYYRVTYLSDLLSSQSLLEAVDRMLVVYPNEEDLLSDEIGYALTDRIYLTGLDLIMNISDEVTKDTLTYQYISPFNKKRVSFN